MKKLLVIILGCVICICNLNTSVTAMENEQDVIFSQNWMIEDGYIEEIVEEILPFSTIVNMNWKIGAMIKKQTKAFYKKAGSKMTVDIKVKKKKKVRIGIVAKDIGRMYVDTTNTVKRTFNIKKTGEYSVFVTNKSDNAIYAVGSYTK